MKLSIITVNLNNADGLRTTIESVISQTYTNFEHIIIDGGSTDGSVEVIKEYEKEYARVQGGLYWVSEPDKGIYNGMNKGIKVAKGEYCLFLNSGDFLINNETLSEVLATANKQIIYCNLITDKKRLKYPESLTLFFFYERTLGHPSTLINTKLIKKMGGYNEDLTYAADYEFFCKALMFENANFQYIDKDLTFFAIGGISTNTKTINNALIEKEMVFRNLFPLIVKDYTDLYSLKKEIRRYTNSRIIRLVVKIQKIIYNN